MMLIAVREDLIQSARARKSGSRSEPAKRDIRRTNEGEHAGANLADAVAKVEQADGETAEDDAAGEGPYRAALAGCERGGRAGRETEGRT